MEDKRHDRESWPVNRFIRYKNEVTRYAILLFLVFTGGLYCGVSGYALRILVYKAQIRSLQEENTSISKKNAQLNDKLFDCQIAQNE